MKKIVPVVVVVLISVLMLAAFYFFINSGKDSSSVISQNSKAKELDVKDVEQKDSSIYKKSVYDDPLFLVTSGVDIKDVPFGYSDIPTQNEEFTLELLTQLDLGDIDWIVVSQPEGSDLQLKKSNNEKVVKFTPEVVGDYEILAKSLENKSEKRTNFEVLQILLFDPEKIDGFYEGVDIETLSGIIKNQSWVDSQSLTEKQLREIVSSHEGFLIIGYDSTFGLLVEYNESDILMKEKLEELKFEKGVSDVRNRFFRGDKTISNYEL